MKHNRTLIIIIVALLLAAVLKDRVPFDLFINQAAESSTTLYDSEAELAEYPEIDDYESEDFPQLSGTSLTDFNYYNIPEWNETVAYVVVNGNVPYFSAEELSATSSYEYYGELDELGRCTTCIANIGTDLMPTEKRESISEVKPTGWKSIKMDFVDGGWLYNRCHLIGYQLTAENANKQNLITGTRYLNVTGMLPFENMVADYLKEEQDCHVLYRVTPIFIGDELVARGVLMEAWSMEDEGESICYCVFCYNEQPGVTVDFATGEAWEN